MICDDFSTLCLTLKETKMFKRRTLTSALMAATPVVAVSFNFGVRPIC
jgi:hypothetical protein